MGKKEDRSVIQNIFAHATDLKSISYILGFIFSTTWIANFIYDLFKKSNIGLSALVLVSLIFLFILYLYLKKLQKEFASDDNIDINYISERPKKVLILFLSNIRPEQYTSIPTKMDNNTIRTWLNEGFNSWKMPLKAIDGHKSTLEKIIILTSPESSKQFIQFRKIIKKTSNREFQINEMLIKDINDIEIYNSTFNKIYKDLSEYNESDIVIDVTSGIKLYSIAGSYFALSTEKIIQYVDTNTLKVYQFNNKILQDSD